MRMFWDAHLGQFGFPGWLHSPAVLPLKILHPAPGAPWTPAELSEAILPHSPSPDGCRSRGSKKPAWLSANPGVKPSHLKNPLLSVFLSLAEGDHHFHAGGGHADIGWCPTQVQRPAQEAELGEVSTLGCICSPLPTLADLPGPSLAPTGGGGDP